MMYVVILCLKSENSADVPSNREINEADIISNFVKIEIKRFGVWLLHYPSDTLAGEYCKTF